MTSPCDVFEKHRLWKELSPLKRISLLLSSSDISERNMEIICKLQTIRITLNMCFLVKVLEHKILTTTYNRPNLTEYLENFTCKLRFLSYNTCRSTVRIFCRLTHFVAERRGVSSDMKTSDPCVWNSLTFLYNLL